MLKKGHLLKLYRDGYLEEGEFEGEMAAVELALYALDAPVVGDLWFEDVIAAPHVRSSCQRFVSSRKGRNKFRTSKQCVVSFVYLSK